MGDLILVPSKFPQQTAILAENQKEYQPLPVWQDEQMTVSLWKFTWWERIKILFGAPLWIYQLNFNSPLQPQLPTLDNPFPKDTKC